MKASEWLSLLKDEKSKEVIRKIIETSTVYGVEDPVINVHFNGSQDVLVIEV